MISKHTVFSLLAAGLLTLTGCGGGGGGGGSESTTGQLTLGLTDAPLESAQSVIVAFTGLELKPVEGPPLDPITFDENSCDDYDLGTGTCYIDLLELTGDTRKVVFSGDIPAGEYEWVRLMVEAERNITDSYIELDNGNMCPIWIPSGDQTGLKIVSGITVTANGVSDYTLDFDVRSSITAPSGIPFLSDEACNQSYLMKPAIRIVDTTETVTLAGEVPEELLEGDASCVRDEVNGLFEGAAVYVFENSDAAAVADDIDTEQDNANPITTANVEYDEVSSTYNFEVGYLLAPEDYLLALTCTAVVDLPDSDEFDPTLQAEQEFSFIAEREVSTVVDEPADGSFSIVE